MHFVQYKNVYEHLLVLYLWKGLLVINKILTSQINYY